MTLVLLRWPPIQPIDARSCSLGDMGPSYMSSRGQEDWSVGLEGRATGNARVSVVAFNLVPIQLGNRQCGACQSRRGAGRDCFCCSPPNSKIHWQGLSSRFRTYPPRLGFVLFFLLESCSGFIIVLDGATYLLLVLILLFRYDPARNGLKGSGGDDYAVPIVLPSRGPCKSCGREVFLLLLYKHAGSLL